MALGTGAASERELVATSLYPVLAFGFGIGMLWAVRVLRAQSAIQSRDYLGLFVVAAIGAGVTALARWYFFAKIFDRL